MTSKLLTTDFQCKICNKKYYREKTYNKHILYYSKRDTYTPFLDHIKEKNDIEFENFTLKEVVTELVKSNIKLRKDMEELKKWIQKKKKKMNIIEWLNENLRSNPSEKPIQNYKEYMSDLIITRKELEIVFKLDLIDGIGVILENYIKKHSNTKEIPFQSFDQKDNIIYVYSENMQWEVMCKENFNNIIFSISKQILKEFGKWKQDNEDKLCRDDFSTIFIQNTKKVIGGDIPLEKQQNKIHKNFYKYLKKNLQNIIQYEFI